jgi:phage tail protein X
MCGVELPVTNQLSLVKFNITHRRKTMDNTFILNPSIDSLDIKDAIYERLIKARSITSCLLAGNDGIAELGNKYFYGAILALDDYLEELESLQQHKLEK